MVNSTECIYVFAKDRGRTFLSRIKVRREELWWWLREALGWRGQETPIAGKEDWDREIRACVYIVVTAGLASSSVNGRRPTQPGELSGHTRCSVEGSSPGSLELSARLRCQSHAGRELTDKDTMSIFAFLEFHKPDSLFLFWWRISQTPEDLSVKQPRQEEPKIWKIHTIRGFLKLDLQKWRFAAAKGLVE